HLERIDAVVDEALKRAGISYQLSAVAVTQGPGLAIALEVGIKKAKEIALEHCLPLISVNHMEGHIYSTLSQNKNGNPKREVAFPALCLLVSGGHTQLVFMKGHGEFELIGETLDDACGEALDKAAKILKLGYPGGPIIERLAQKGEPDFPLTRPLKEKTDLNFSYSGLKTQFLYLVENLNEEEFGQNIANLAASFQEAAFEQLVRKTSFAIKMYQPKTLLCGGGVIANQRLRSLLRKLARQEKITAYFPPVNKLIGDNAAMIGVAAGYKLQRKEFVENIESLDRKPRMTL
ncbi:tRNA (adenosine(37)-N6)-threonylcarbamoyltransferase complex transferase subunit TsaD, partial [Patescibacteria group bacterium]|nr:tRNA (adenosine(37)-N6)-threonylcarbamoyltransferase complex transferase subunit TsaD [Patescibacteria group bacterium]